MDNIEQVKNIEGALIGAVLRDGSTYAQAREIVQPANFGIVAFGYAWLACEHLFEQGMAIDVFTVGDEIERMGKMEDFINGQWSGRALLSDLRSNGDPRNVLDYAENVQDYGLKRDLERVFTSGVIHAKNGRRAKDIISDMTSALGNISVYSQKDEYTVPISTAVSEGYDQTDAASRGAIVGVSTGFIDLDKILNGGLYKENVYLVAARPGQGKTALLLSIAKNAAQKFGKKVAIFSLEMSRAQVAQRMVAQEAEIDLSKIIRGKMEGDEWMRYTHAVEVIAGLHITINDLSSINIAEIRQTSRKIKAAAGLDLVIVDYIQLADAGKQKQNRELEVSEVSRGLKYLARELDVPVLAASQLSREIEKRTGKRPVLSDLRESGSLEQDAYCVMFIYKQDDGLKQNIAEVIVSKHRNGSTGSIELYWNAPFTRFDNATSKLFNLKDIE